MSRRPHVRTSVRPLTAWTAVLLAAACSTVAAACLWDRDTLAAEARGLPGVLEVVVGRFERHPDAYYAVRLERAEADRAMDPGDWRSWDDAVVALDKLGRHDEAVALASAQRTAMSEAAAAGGLVSPSDDARYRQLANHGTVLAHRWIVAGSSDDRRDLQAARELIADAIELNPDAHFGREVWQLRTIDWMIEGATIRADGDEHRLFSGEWHYFHMPSLLHIDDPDGDDPHDRQLEGLIGMIALGGGWESIDLLVALQQILLRQRRNAVALAVEQRIKELLEAGRRPRHPGTEMAMLPWGTPYPSLAELMADPEAHPLQLELAGMFVVQPERVTRWFDAERTTSRQWHAERTAWVKARLATHHPDRDDDFWVGAPPMPGLDYPWWTPRLLSPMATVVLVIFGIVAILLGIRVVRAVRWRTPAGR